MPLRFQKSGELDRTYLRAWRKARVGSQARLGELMGTSGENISRVETRTYGYTQAFIEEAAAALGVPVWALLSCDPANYEELEGLFRMVAALPPEPQKQAIRVLRELVRPPEAAAIPASSPARKRPLKPSPNQPPRARKS